MTFIQEALITTYTEVDPWSWLGTSGPIAWGAVGFVCRFFGVKVCRIGDEPVANSCVACVWWRLQMCSVPSVGSGPTCWQSSRWYVVQGIHSTQGHQQLDVARCVDASDFCDQRAGQAEATLDPPQADLGPLQQEYAAPVSTPVTY